MSKYLSIIYAARNDDYAPGFIGRFQNSIDHLSYHIRKNKFQSDVEIVIVEWNPMPDKKTLEEVLTFTKDIPVRIIQVHNGFHMDVKHTQYDAKEAEKIPFYEFHAKNVGGRRANGEFILFTTADILFNNEIIKKLAQKDLSNKNFYRIDRKDLLHSIDPTLGVKESLNQVKNNLDSNLIRKNLITRQRYVHTKASGDFLLIPKWAFLEMRGYPEIRCSGAAIDRFGLYSASTVCKQIILNDPMAIFHQPHMDREKIFELNDRKNKNAYKTCHLTFSNINIKKWFKESINIMEKKGKNMNINDKEWGLNHKKLRETYIN